MLEATKEEHLLLYCPMACSFNFNLGSEYVRLCHSLTVPSYSLFNIVIYT